MNDRQDPHGAQFYGYDAYGRPIYHDPYGQPPQTEPGSPDQHGQYASYDPYAPQPDSGSSGRQWPGTPDPQTYPAAGTYDTGGYDPGTYDTSAYDTGALGAGHHGTGSYDSGAHGAYGAGGPPAAQYSTGGYDTGNHSVGGDGYDPVPQPYDPQQYDPQQYGMYSPTTPPLTPPQESGGRSTEAYASAAPPQTYTEVPPSPSYPGARGEEEAGSVAGSHPGLPHPRGSAEDQGPAKEEEPEGGYQTEQFAFIEEPDEESEDVIDWLKFTESRTERREEARRRARNRVVALVVVLALALVGGLGYLWQTGRLPGLAEEGGQAAAGAESRQVIVVHLRELESGDVSTALLVNNETAGKGTTVLLPNSLALTSDGGESTTLGKSFGAEGAGATRDALDMLLGSSIEGSWRLDTPYLENLVEMVGGITLTSDATVPGTKKGSEPQVEKGAGQELDGQAAVAYATHRGEAEPQTAQLARFGQVMQAVLKKLSDDTEQAAATIEALGQILDFSLTEAELGRALAELAAHAKKGDYRTELLPVEADGTLSEETAQGLVKEVLGGSVRNADSSATVRFAVRNASGQRGAADGAQVTLVNGGFTVVGTGSLDSATERSTVTYREEKHAEQAKEAAKTLGLSEQSVTKGEGAANADVTVVLGRDYGD